MPKIIGTSLAEHRQTTRARLFRALATLMEQRGFDSLTFAEIAAEAGIGRTAIYNHFPDKESLLLAFIEHETGEYLTSLEEARVGGLDPLERLRVYIRRQFELKRFFHFTAGPALSHTLSPEALAQTRRHIQLVEAHLHAILREAIAEGVIPDQDVQVVATLVNGCVHSRAIPEQEPERSRFLRATESFVLRALGAPA